MFEIAAILARPLGRWGGPFEAMVIDFLPGPTGRRRTITRGHHSEGGVFSTSSFVIWNEHWWEILESFNLRQDFSLPEAFEPGEFRDELTARREANHAAWTEHVQAFVHLARQRGQLVGPVEHWEHDCAKTPLRVY